MQHHNLPFVCVSVHSKDVYACLNLETVKERVSSGESTMLSCMVFVWGGHPASAAHPDKDRRPGLQLEGFASAKSNIVRFSKRVRPSLGPEPPGDGAEASGKRKGPRINRSECNARVSIALYAAALFQPL